MILLLSEGASYRRIQSLLHTTAPTISRWKNRFVRRRVAGLAEERHPGQKPTVRTAKLQARILTAIKDGPKDGSTHWSCRKLATRFGVGKDTIQRILAQADVRPHRLERYMASDDPDFETKAADVIALYLSPPQHAAVFCIDEKTAIQALDRLDPRLPLSPGRLERHGFEYRRNGTLSLYAALDVKTGKVQGKTAARHTRAEFVDFLDQVVSGCKPQREIHIILDNLSAHKTAKVQQFLERHSNVKLHFTPTYSSWLNQVEIWFARLEREVIARGIFTSVKDLARKLMRYIRAYSKTARPFKWKVHRCPPENPSMLTNSL
jgi:transposase